MKRYVFGISLQQLLNVMAKCREKLKPFGRITFLASQKYRFTVARKKLTNLNFCSDHDSNVTVY